MSDLRQILIVFQDDSVQVCYWSKAQLDMNKGERQAVKGNMYFYFQISCICIFKSLVFVFSSLLDLNCQISCICVSVCICITMQVGQWIWTKRRSKGEIVVRWDRQFDADLINIRWKYKYLNTNTTTQIQKERLCLRRMQRNQNKS